ncbi:c-type cytochrome [Stieleria varia]|nr:c-type cytochrome [Stieleria varia]
MIIGLLIIAIISILFTQELPSRVKEDVNMATDDSADLQSREYPEGRLGEVIRLGETLVKETSIHPMTRPLVGNRLNCTSCHLDAGRHPKAASFVGVASAYPAYSPRESAVITLEERIANCFLRSQNGSRPVIGGQVSVAIAAYITWMSRRTPIEMNPIAPLGPNHLDMLDVEAFEPDIVQGETLYVDRCTDCHLADGSGSEDGPPVWGDHSFNDGAGLSKVAKMASWLKVAMPPDDTDLTDREAIDLAAYINSHPRPKFYPNNKTGPLNPSR